MVQDDIALPENPQPRGIAGTVLVQKSPATLRSTANRLRRLKRWRSAPSTPILYRHGVCHLSHSG